MGAESNLLAKATPEIFRKIREMQIDVADGKVTLRLVTSAPLPPNWLKDLQVVLFIREEDEKKTAASKDLSQYLCRPTDWADTDSNHPSAMIWMAHHIPPPVVPEPDCPVLNNVDIVSIVFGSSALVHQLPNANSVHAFRTRATIPDTER